MSENQSKGRSVVEAVEGLAKAVPVYEDGLQPAVKQLGASLETIAKTVNVALSPLRALIWGAEQLQEWLDTQVAEKLRYVPQDRIRTPAANIAGPTMEAMKFTGGCESLRELYANLLARSMDAHTAGDTHPAFVEIIKQLTPDEARILGHLARLPSASIPLIPLVDILVEVPPPEQPSAILTVTIARNISMIAYDSNCEQPSQVAVYIDNLCRLGIFNIDPFRRVADDDAYSRIKKHPDVIKSIESIQQKLRIEWTEKACHVTPLGQLFLEACVVAPATCPQSTEVSQAGAS